MKELKCPFCNKKLDQSSPQSAECKNDDCRESYFMYGSVELWKALICAKKQVDIAKRDLWTLQAQSGFCGFVAKKSLEDMKKAGAK